MAEDHAADRAAGEVVFSSDGLPPPLVVPAIKTAEKSGEDGDMNVLDTGGDTPAGIAFEVFSGKVYKVPGGTGSLRGTTTASMAETPAQRLARLQQEVAELEQDLSGATTAGAEKGDEGTPAFLEMVSDLKKRLETQAGVAASFKNQEEMTRSIQQHLQEWETKKAASTTKASDSANDAGVTYELYGGVPFPAASGASNSAAPSLEERLLQIESLVGAGNASTATNKNKNESLLKRLEEMEQFMTRLDPKTLEQAAAKAKVIRSDLEAASKARNKLASAATFRKEDAQTISALYDQMTQLEGLSDHLPALVARLQQLASLHAQSSGFAVRLSQSEKEVVQLQAVLKQMEGAVAKAEEGMTANVATIEKNMQQLDERMKKL